MKTISAKEIKEIIAPGAVRWEHMRDRWKEAWEEKAKKINAHFNTTKDEQSDECPIYVPTESP